MIDNLATKAIKAALCGNWKLAIDLNKKILNEEIDNFDALNRLARAYAETGKIKKAKGYSKKVIRLDPFNKIASSSLARWENMKEGEAEKPCSKYSPKLFIEEVGRTKISPLINLSSKKTISTLRCADELNLNLSGHRVSILGADGKYVGRLPDNLGSRIKRMCQKGFKYSILVKSANIERVIVFIKQLQSPSGVDEEVSFPAEKGMC